MENYAFQFKDNNIKVTVSIGAASVNEKINSAGELLDNADKALYNAKNGGRNRLVLSQN